MGSIILFVACFLFVIIVLFSLLTYAFFWYEAANGPHVEHLKRISDGKVGRLVLRGICSSVTSSVMVLLLNVFLFSRAIRKPNRGAHSSALPPVVFIHGLYHNATAWVFYRRWMRRHGVTDVHSFQYNSMKYVLEDLLDQLDVFMNRILAEQKAESVIIVGHSLGGLIGRAYLNRVADRSLVSALVTLGTPHQGSKLSVLGIGRLARSLEFKGPMIRDVESGFAASCRVPRLAFYSPVDNMVLPNDALRTDDPGWAFIETKGMSHVSMLYSKTLADQAAEFLKRVCPPAAPRA